MASSDQVARNAAASTAEEHAETTDAKVAALASGVPGNDADAAADGYVVLLVSSAGIIDTVLSGPATMSSHPEILTGQAVAEIWPEEVAAPVVEHIRRVLRSRQSRTVRLHVSQSAQTYEFTFVPQGRERVMMIVRDSSRLHGKIAHLELLAYTDKQTGLPNREWLLAELERVAERLRLKGGRAAVICIEIDELNVAAHTTSQATRDDILNDLAARMLAGLRGANDTSESDDERYSAVARIDYQKFAIVLPRIETGEDAEAVTTRIMAMLQRPVDVGGNQHVIRAAAGIALYPQDGEDAIELFDSAVTAMCDARNSGHDEPAFHSGTMKLRALERQDLELELRSALDNDEFTLNYLPIVERGTFRPVSAEALLRWPNAVFGSKTISEVVTVAEYTGLILPIGEWVFRRACEQLARWHESGYGDLSLAVNVSAQEFARGSLIERTRRILEEVALDPQSITLEIKEHLLFRDAMHDYPVCKGLKALGVHLAVDDYGTGICSFDHIARSPVDAVKIHPNFVSRVASTAAGRAACAAITAMAHELGIDVVAEGVETLEQAKLLDQVGCDYLQGFSFCKPVPADGLTEYLQQTRSRGCS